MSIPLLSSLMLPTVVMKKPIFYIMKLDFKRPRFYNNRVKNSLIAILPKFLQHSASTSKPFEFKFRYFIVVFHEGNRRFLKNGQSRANLFLEQLLLLVDYYQYDEQRCPSHVIRRIHSVRLQGLPLVYLYIVGIWELVDF